MPDLRDVLRQGADVTTGLPDMPAVWMRAVRERRRRRLAGGAVAAAATVAVVAVLGAVLDPGPPAPPQPAVTPALVPAESLPPHPGPLERGRTFDVRALALPYGFSTPSAGWTMAAREPHWLSLHRGDVRINLQTWDAVIDPTADDPSVATADEVPADLLGWVQRHPRLRVDERRSVDVAGETWQLLDVSVRAPLPTSPTECGTTPCVLLGLVGAEPVELLATERTLLHLRADDPAVLVVSFPARRDGPGTAAMNLIDSFHERPLR